MTVLLPELPRGLVRSCKPEPSTLQKHKFNGTSPSLSNTFETVKINK